GHAEVVKRLREAEAAKGTQNGSAERKYCTAYHVGDLRRYSSWTETQQLADEDVVFLHQDYTVTKSIWAGEDVIFDNVTDQWKDFCNNDLRFAVPDSLDLIAKPVEAAQTAAS
ncbi:MAG TPA: hypothetical protein VLB87_08205, partial [Pyrinomonadaceae bacterium]|nr:hypothetical protein [Pyrinomonadaceae bacterium]